MKQEWRFFAVLSAVLATTVLVFNWSGAQIQLDDLPPALRGLPPAEFAQRANQMLQPTDPAAGLPPAAVEAIRKRAAEILMAADTIGQQSYDTSLQLLDIGQDQLTEPQRGTLRARLARRSDNLPDLGYRGLRSRIGLMEGLKVAKAERGALAAGWVDVHDTEPLPPDDVQWLLMELRVPSSNFDDQNFSVTWSGMVQAPNSGPYTFSITPFDVGFDAGRKFVRQSMTVSVDGRQIISATTGNWNSQAAPMRLTGGRKVPIEVHFTYHRSDGSWADKNPVAMLYWEGPGMNKTLVPDSALFQPNGTDRGLQAKYRSVVDGKETVEVRTESGIDNAWVFGNCIIPRHPPQRRRLGQQLMRQLTAPQYMADVEREGDAEDRHALVSDLRLVEYMNRGQRASFIRQLKNRPAMLRSISWWKMIYVYYFLRSGSMDEALDLVGTWAQAHPDIELDFTRSFFDDNGRKYRDFTIGTVWHYPPHIQRLRERFLETPDGRCVLPVAYTLAYAHLVQDKMQEWIDFLDGRLEDERLTGRRRVNWLIARARSEEIRYGAPSQHLIGVERLNTGRQWLEEAEMIAQSEPDQLRVFREMVTRLTARGDIKGAEAIIARAEQKLSSAPARQAIAQWRAEMQRVQDEVAQFRAQRLEEGNRALAALLQRRMQKASDRSDSAAEARYRGMLDAGAAAATTKAQIAPAAGAAGGARMKFYQLGYTQK